MSSAWVRAPQRFSEATAANNNSNNEDPNATFAPQLVSDPSLRGKVRSSSYGTVLPKVEKVLLEAEDLRPWQEQPTFEPDLPESELRQKARSSAYGTATVAPPTRPAPQMPAFSPELVTKSSKLSQQWQGRSAGYGTTTAANRERREPPRPSFTPEYPKNKLREKVNAAVTSSRYGTANPPTTPRPKSAPPRDRGLGLHARPNQHPQADVFADRASSNGFVLDGVSVGLTIDSSLKYPGKPPAVGLLAASAPLSPSEHTRKLKEAARSSQYGLQSPTRAERRDPPPPEPRFVVARGSWTEELPPTPRSSLTDQARSHGYGSHSPIRVERTPPRTSEPRWNPSRSFSAAELKAVPRSDLNSKVSSHSYGTASPEKGERPQVMMAPVWVPPSGKSSIPPPELVARRSSYDHIRSAYGSDYTPFRSDAE